MHILSTTAGQLDGAAQAVDLCQTPADVVILSAADSELAAIALALDRMSPAPFSLRLANIMTLQHNYSVDLYCETIIRHARLVVLRLLGGQSYWPWGLTRICACVAENGIALVVLPGGGEPDPGLSAASTIDSSHIEALRDYFVQGGPANMKNLLLSCARLLGIEAARPEPATALAMSGLYRCTEGSRGKAGLVFYRSVIEGGQTAPIDALMDALAVRGIGTRAVYVASLKDAASVKTLHEVFDTPDCILNMTGFALGDARDPLALFNVPVLQCVLSGSDEAAWRDSPQGLSARDLAMNVVLPELDGRILTRAISFKSQGLRHAPTQCALVTYAPVPDRIDFVADLAANWVRLRLAPAAEKNIAIVLANYPNRDGRIANGVGYDTPASTISLMQHLKQYGYHIENIPETGNMLIEALQRGPTNAHRPNATGSVFLASEIYARWLATLPMTAHDALQSRWGGFSKDPFFSASENGFHLPILLYGSVAVCIQPARGYNIDPRATFHDPDLVPPHGYLAFYLWLRTVFAAHAIIHNGKHGNLEWLPGKATALSQACWPEIALGPTPQFYPFIVNDPGEGTQAKRRTSAVIIDHLVPPLARAETYGPLKTLEGLVDEYYQAQGLDTRRAAVLARDILDLAAENKIDADANFTGNAAEDLVRLDAFLCDLKEAQIRDGLHILGQSPQGALRNSLLVALSRIPRGLGEGGDASLIRALAIDFDLHGFDPLSCDMAAPWSGPRPEGLAAMSSDPWRTAGDTLERLELFALHLVERPFDPQPCPSPGPASAAVLAALCSDIAPRLDASGPNELAMLARGLAGQCVPPGPSGAPTRGRLDVLPTGRNFFSLDNRAVPTPAAWNLGQRSAESLLARHFEDFGRWPRTMALSAWGTANMRTGGDDIAQALALMGARPVWEPASWRVTGFEIMPLAQLGRPRVDVTLRISGFFRDAFPLQIELLDKVVGAVAALEGEGDDNPLATQVQQETALLLRQSPGLDETAARALACQRIFGAKPGAYGAGLQALIDEKLWTDRTDFAAAFVSWGSWAYGAATGGVRDEASFRRRLKNIEAVIHNQDNREHDLLDSDDYYQFEGGLSAAIEVQSGQQPRVYHNDHSRPERPVIRTLEEEVARVMRSRVVNPKWIAGVRRHGYKGAFEIAATVDYMFAFAATTGAVKSHHFDMAHAAFLADGETRAFLKDNNPHALQEIAGRLQEAIMRGLWQPRSNSAHDLVKELAR